LTAAGPQPQTLHVAAGDTVTFVNQDNVDHAVVSTQGGISGPTMTPGTSWSVVLNTAGKFTYAETGTKRALRGTLVVAGLVPSTAPVTLTASPALLLFGNTAVLTGHSTAPAGTAIVLLRRSVVGARVPRSCSALQGWTSVGAPVTPAADGSFTFNVRPASGMVYRAQSTNGQYCSATLTLLVRPVLHMTLTATRAKTGHDVTVTARIMPAAAATSLVLSRLDPGTSAWRKVAVAQTSAAGIARFTYVAVSGTVRLHVSTNAKARGAYLPATSVTRAVTGIGAPIVQHAHIRHSHKK
jgi:hypothetical protein